MVIGVAISAVLLCLLGTAFALLDGLFGDDTNTYDALGCGSDVPVDPAGPMPGIAELVEDAAPPAVAESRRLLGGTDDVGEQHRGEGPAYRAGRCPGAGEELQHGVPPLREVFGTPGAVEVAGDLPERGARDVLGQETSELDRADRVPAGMDRDGRVLRPVSRAGARALP